MMEHDAGSLAMFAMLSQGVGTLLALVLDVALIVVATGVVRRSRPDASGVLLTAGVILLIGTLLAPVTSMMASVLTAQQAGPDGVARVHMLLGLLFGAVRAVAFAILLVGIVRLADPGENAPRC